MRVKLKENVRVGPGGNATHHKAGETVTLPDDVAEDLINKGRAERVKRDVRIGLEHNQGTK